MFVLQTNDHSELQETQEATTPSSASGQANIPGSSSAAPIVIEDDKKAKKRIPDLSFIFDVEQPEEPNHLEVALKIRSGLRPLFVRRLAVQNKWNAHFNKYGVIHPDEGLAWPVLNEYEKKHGVPHPIAKELENRGRIPAGVRGTGLKSDRPALSPENQQRSNIVQAQMGKLKERLASKALSTVQTDHTPRTKTTFKYECIHDCLNKKKCGHYCCGKGGWTWDQLLKAIQDKRSSLEKQLNRLLREMRKLRPDLMDLTPSEPMQQAGAAAQNEGQGPEECESVDNALDAEILRAVAEQEAQDAARDET